jgi:hypothetical protein
MIVETENSIYKVTIEVGELISEDVPDAGFKLQFKVVKIKSLKDSRAMKEGQAIYGNVLDIRRGQLHLLKGTETKLLTTPIKRVIE